MGLFPAGAQDPGGATPAAQNLVITGEPPANTSIMWLNQVDGHLYCYNDDLSHWETTNEWLYQFERYSSPMQSNQLFTLGRIEGTAAPLPFTCRFVWASISDAMAGGSGQVHLAQAPNQTSNELERFTFAVDTSVQTSETVFADLGYVWPQGAAIFVWWTGSNNGYPLLIMSYRKVYIDNG